MENNYRSLPTMSDKPKFEDKETDSLETLEPIPEGRYSANVRDVQFKLSKKDTHYLAMSFNVKFDGGNRVLWKNFFPFEKFNKQAVITKDGWLRFAKSLRYLGLTPEEIDKFEFNLHTPALCGLDCVIIVSQEEYMQKVRNVVLWIYPPNDIKGVREKVETQLREAEAIVENCTVEKINKVFEDSDKIPF